MYPYGIKTGNIQQERQILPETVTVVENQFVPPAINSRLLRYFLTAISIQVSYCVFQRIGKKDIVNKHFTQGYRWV
jgi:hypothetical protein